MSELIYNVQTITDEIRAQLDEQNQDSVSTASDIIPTLNRAQDYAFDTLARKYPEPLVAFYNLTLVGGQQEYQIPRFVFEDRIEKVEMAIPASQIQTINGGTTYREVQRVSYRDLSNYESASKTNVPYYHAIYGRTIRFVPTPTGTYGARIWYLQTPEKLVLPQGRVTIVNNSSNYVIVDQAGPDLVTEMDDLGSYVNLVDGQTGVVKGSLQIQSITDNKITFRTTPARAAVLDRTVTGSLTDLAVAPDDYLSTIDGTCIPYYGRPVINFMIQYTVSEITRKLGGQADTEEKILQKFEQQLERTWVGREQQLRIKKRSQNWGTPTRRWYYE